METLTKEQMLKRLESTTRVEIYSIRAIDTNVFIAEDSGLVILEREKRTFDGICRDICKKYYDYFDFGSKDKADEWFEEFESEFERDRGHLLISAKDVINHVEYMSNNTYTERVYE